MRVETIACLDDNYAYLVSCPETGAAAIVDPSEADPLLRVALARGIAPTSIWCTHHHGDHIGDLAEVAAALGIEDVVAHEADRGRIAGATRWVEDGAAWPLGASSVRAIHTPGHTRGALSYHCVHAGHGAVFTGDTLFVAGCGRLFEGTAEQLFTSLAKLAALPADTRVYCGHEYTLSNLRFARHAEPDNLALDPFEAQARAAQSHGTPTVPSTIAQELAINPFMRASSIPQLAARRSAKDHF